LTAKTVIEILEDAADYRAFEAAIIADYDAQTAVERELVVRLASLLRRIRHPGFYAEWKEKYGPEAWAMLEQRVGALS